ncbi:MAG TPA: M20/M25/M40 family metallo-hydrolase [Blastocatellia bacterium]|nr:M20/M25/M40 family metallo-hydrolase [Blastocatellia bacterium]
MLRKRITAPLIALLVFSLVVPAQVPAPATGEKVDLEMMKKIREEGLQRSQVMNTLSWMTDVIGPRLTGSPQMKHANEWTKTKLTEWGLENARLEPWGPFGRGWSLEKFSANVIEPVPFPIIGYPKAWTPGTSGAITGEVVYLDIKTEADFEKYRGKLNGAIVLSVPMREVKAWFNPPGTRFSDSDLLTMSNAAPPGAGGPRQGGPVGTPNQEQMQRFREQQAVAQKRAEFLRTEGAAVLVDIGRSGDGGTLFVSSGGPRDKSAPQALPSITMTVEHYGRLVRMLEKGVKVKMEVDIKAKFHDDDQMAYNTIAEIPGTDLKDEIVMLGGHLDSWHSGTGATDNAAGCAVGMEAVRILKTLGVQPRRTIRIALWSGEEQGLLGSRAYVNQHFAERKTVPGQPPAAQQFGGGGGGGRGAQGPIVLKPAHDKFSAYFNLDNGTGKIRGVYLQGNEAVRPIFRAWLEPFRDLGASTLTISNTGGTDHLSFDGVGLPGFQFIQDEIEYDTRTHHSNMDVYERLQADDMKQASVIMAAFVYNAAMRDEKLPRKPLPPNTERPVAAAPAAAPEAAKAAAGKTPAVTSKKANAAKGKQ